VAGSILAVGRPRATCCLANCERILSVMQPIHSKPGRLAEMNPQDVVARSGRRLACKARESADGQLDFLNGQPAARGRRLGENRQQVRRYESVVSYKEKASVATAAGADRRPIAGWIRRALRQTALHAPINLALLLTDNACRNNPGVRSRKQALSRAGFFSSFQSSVNIRTHTPCRTIL